LNINLTGHTAPLRFWLTLFVVSLTFSPAFAQGEAAQPPVGVDELVQRALQNNPQPAIARANLEAARQRAGALKSLPNPVLQIVAGFAGNEEARDEEVLLSQPIDLFGQRRAKRKVLEAETKRVAAESELVQRALIVEVKNAAAQLFAAQEAQKLSAEQVQVAQAFSDAAARRAELGDVPQVQAQRAGLELLRVQNEATNTRADRLARQAVLNQLIGQAPETPLTVALPVEPALLDLLRTGGEAVAASPAATPPANGSIFTQRADLLAAQTSRLDIVSARAALESKQAQIAEIDRQRLPQFELQARRSSTFGRDGSYAARAVVTMPLLDLGSIRREKQAAQSEVQAQQAQIRLLESQAGVQLEQALVSLDQQQATVERYRGGIVPQTLDLLRKTQIGFAQGASSYLEVLEAQRTLRQVQAEYLEALVGVRTAQAALESAVGTPLVEGGVAQ